MRKGENKVRHKLTALQPCSHRVIIPLYIPSEEGYYKDAFKIFKMCLFSLKKTATSLLKIAVVSNGSTSLVNKKLLDLSTSGYIDELIIETEAIGKVNSVLKALRTTEERLVTITDADVMFLDNWEDQVVKVFNSFPKAGAVCPVPVYRKHLDLTFNIWFKYLFSGKIKFSPVKNIEALQQFAKSIGWSHLPKEFGDTIGTLKAKDNTIAVLGCSHFVATYKSEVFKKLPLSNSRYLLGGDSILEYTDLPVVKCDGYRLSTYTNNAYHLGNVFEPWMQDTFDSLKSKKQQYVDYNGLKTLSKAPFIYFLTHKVFKRIIKFKPILRLVLKFKGLSKSQVFNFVDRVY